MSLRRPLHPPPRLRDHARHGAGRARLVLVPAARPRPLPERRLPDRHHHHHAQGRERRGDGERRHQADRGDRQHDRGHRHAALDHARRACRSSSSSSCSSKNSASRRAGGARQGRDHRLAQLPEGTDSPIIEKFDVDATPIMSVVVAGNRNLREVTEVAKKQIKERIETAAGRRRGHPGRRLGARRQHLRRPRPHGGATASRSSRCGEALQTAEHRDPGRPRRPGRTASWCCAPWAAWSDVPAFADLIVATYAGPADPRPRHRPGRERRRRAAQPARA